MVSFTNVEVNMYNNINVWEEVVNTESLDEYSKDYLKTLPEKTPTVEWLWQEMKSACRLLIIHGFTFHNAEYHA